MAWERPILEGGTFTASANYSSASSQFRVVTSTGTSFKRTATAGAFALGVLQDTPSSGQSGNIMYYGVTKVRVLSSTRAAIAVGAKLCGSSVGGIISSTAVARYTLGRALEAISSASTGIITMLITHEGGGSSGAATGA